MGVSTQRELYVGVGENVAVPGFRRMLQHHDEGLFAHSVQRGMQVAAVGKDASAVVALAGNDERVATTPQDYVLILQELQPQARSSCCVSRSLAAFTALSAVI